jgi:hypothetical protein
MGEIMRKGQATIELVLALICVWFLLFGSFMVFFWLNERLVLRQEAYETDATYGRVKAGSASGYVPIKEEARPGDYQPLNLDLLK